jgi:hypothetical protein
MCGLAAAVHHDGTQGAERRDDPGAGRHGDEAGDHRNPEGYDRFPDQGSGGSGRFEDPGRFVRVDVERVQSISIGHGEGHAHPAQTADETLHLLG